jgi:hypothetical protein
MRVFWLIAPKHPAIPLLFPKDCRLAGDLQIAEAGALKNNNNNEQYPFTQWCKLIINDSLHFILFCAYI